MTRSAWRAVRRRRDAAGLPEAEFARLFSDHVAWHEEMYVEGPSRQDVRKACDGAGLDDVEMMVGLAGKRVEMRQAARSRERLPWRARPAAEPAVRTPPRCAVNLITLG